MATMTYDQMSLKVLLSDAPETQKQAVLTRLATKAKALVGGGMRCPDCGHGGPHDDNGLAGNELSYCCGKCGTHFDADQA